MSSTTYDPSAAVERGARLLTERLGPDFVGRINLDTLDISCSTNCMMGQLFMKEWSRTHRSVAGESPYDLGCRILFGDGCAHFRNIEEKMRDYGFDGSGYYYELNDAWRKVLTPMIERRVRERELVTA